MVINTGNTIIKMDNIVIVKNSDGLGLKICNLVPDGLIKVAGIIFESKEICDKVYNSLCFSLANGDKYFDVMTNT